MTLSVIMMAGEESDFGDIARENLNKTFDTQGDSCVWSLQSLLLETKRRFFSSQAVFVLTLPNCFGV